ncbi:Sugar transporter ERD6-like [Melia azedarach]|uniref:Sugar transporter ERD6-like n=1 Tax=Melia azedarach TaxID=155640 RepID=A0ACC1Y7V6_MELAZ|nr:Sugar transporter ERD6-like [Melia azedarach]
MEEDNSSVITSSLIVKSGVSMASYDSNNNEEEELLLLQTQHSSPVTLRVIFSSLVAVCGSYVYGHAVGYSSPAETGIIEDLGLTTAEYSVFSSILTIGAMLGAVLSGRIADLIGRRGAMGISQMFCISGWLAMIFSKDAEWLDIGRFVLGFGIGLVSYAVPIYIAEITPKHVRGSFTALNPLLMGFGQSFAFLFGSLINWRILALIGIIPGVIQLPGLFFVPESPRWLAKVGRMKDFEAALQILRGENADISEEAAEIRDYTNFFSVSQISGDGFLNMFQRKYVHSLIVGVGLIVFQRFGGLYGFIFYASSIFESAGFSSRIGTIAAAIVQIITTALGVVLVDRSGRRPMLLISTTGACLGCLITGLAFVFKDPNCGGELSAILVLIGVLAYLGFLQLGLGGIPWIIMSEEYSSFTVPFVA